MTDKTVTTSTAVIASFPPPNASHGDYVGWMVGTTASVIAAILWLRRRTSRDSTEIAKDRAEESLIGKLANERDKAMEAAAEAWSRRTEDAKEIAGLRATNEYLKRDIERLTLDVERLSRQLDQVSAAMARITPGFQLELKTP